MEACLGEWTPRNILRQAKAAATEKAHSCEEALRNVLMPRLMKALRAYPEAREAIVAMFLAMHRRTWRYQDAPARRRGRE